MSDTWTNLCDSIIDRGLNKVNLRELGHEIKQRIKFAPEPKFVGDVEIDDKGSLLGAVSRQAITVDTSSGMEWTPNETLQYYTFEG